MSVYVNRSQALAERLIKLRDYLYINATPTHAVKAADILAHLANEGHDVEIKTLYRDIETLRNFFDLDIDYDGRQRGYTLKNPQFEPYELRMIVNSIQAAQFITQDEADRLTDKIKKKLADRYTRPSLKRKTYIPNRVHTVNEEAMKGLDVIYEAIAQDRKISCKYFEYTFSGHNKTKKYHKLDNSKIIAASPYAVVWAQNKFWIYAVLKIPKDIWYKEGLEYDIEYGAYVDDGEIIEDGDRIDFWCEDMDDTGLYVYESQRFDLELMEQIKILAEKQEGKAVAQKWLDGINTSISSEIIKLKAGNKYLSDIIDKFGNNVSMLPDGDRYFIATIHEEPTPELYIWTRRFDPPIEIIYPENAEDDLRSYFLSLAKGEAPDSDFYGTIKADFPYDDIR